LKFRYRLLIFLLILFCCAGNFFEYIIQFFPHAIILLPFIKDGYSLVCHQNTAKLIELNCGHTLTCARCTGIYLGFLSSSFIFLFKNKIEHLPIILLFLASSPVIVDVIFKTAGFYSYSKLIAFSTGLLFGSTLFLYFYKSTINFFNELQLRNK